jgi:hypothetical protein
VIRRSAARHWFANADKAGEVAADQRAYAFPVKETYIARDWEDAKAFEDDRKGQKSWPGLILP